MIETSNLLIIAENLGYDWSYSFLRGNLPAIGGKKSSFLSGLEFPLDPGGGLWFMLFL